MQFGDGWNQEDLSIWSADQVDDPADPDAGARALQGFCRPWVRAAQAVAPDRVMLTVADVGDGIDPVHLPHLTRRFYRTDPGRSRASGGTGLGLAIVKHVVERHRGRLDIASKPGEGTTVTVRLAQAAASQLSDVTE